MIALTGLYATRVIAVYITTGILDPLVNSTHVYITGQY